MTEKIIIRDTVLEEIHRTREEIAARFNYDIGAMIEDARKRMEASGRPIWKGPSTPVKTKTEEETAASTAS